MVILFPKLCPIWSSNDDDRTVKSAAKIHRFADFLSLYARARGIKASLLLNRHALTVNMGETPIAPT